MERVDFLIKKTGKTVLMPAHQAEVLRKVGLGTYATRDMARQVFVAPTLTAGDGLDAMTREQLFELAERRGIKVHGSSGADKVRAALRA